jgi:TonB family protein
MRALLVGAILVSFVPQQTAQAPVRAGSGIVDPKLISNVQPKYTPEAMKAKIQGSVELEAIVLTDGTVGDVRVLKSLDKDLGLDQAAIAAAKQWKFRPGTDRSGNPLAGHHHVDSGLSTQGPSRRAADAAGARADPERGAAGLPAGCASVRRAWTPVAGSRRFGGAEVHVSRDAGQDPGNG